MKRLVAAGVPRVVQLGPCFRAGERGDRHHPEYTMLEWYRAGADHVAAREDTADLLRHAVRSATGSLRTETAWGTVDWAAPWEVRTVRAAFLDAAGWDPVAAWDEHRFNEDLVARVEPSLPREVPVVLTDYPAPAAALSRRCAHDQQIAERWELYVAGVELANAYSELTDASEQRARFVACAAGRRARGQDVYPVDEPFLDALAHGLPACAGVALGIDRLVMLLAGAASLDDVLPFRDG